MQSIARFYSHRVHCISSLLSMKKIVQMCLSSGASIPFSIFLFPLWIPEYHPACLLFILVLAILQKASSNVTSSVMVFLIILCWQHSLFLFLNSSYLLHELLYWLHLIKWNIYLKKTQLFKLLFLNFLTPCSMGFGWYSL